MKTYTTEQLAEILQLDIETVRRFINEGKIGAFKAGRSWRATEDDLKIYMADSRNEAREK